MQLVHAKTYLDKHGTFNIIVPEMCPQEMISAASVCDPKAFASERSDFMFEHLNGSYVLKRWYLQPRYANQKHLPVRECPSNVCISTA
jgi:hypothetical protein